MLASLKACAEAVSKPEWGNGGPSDAGHYNSWPDDTPFFNGKVGGWNSDYGKFFLEWYSEMLNSHGERVLSAAASVFYHHSSTSSSSSSTRGGVVLSGKVAGVHWHYGTRSHAAELTAGYYNTRCREGYLPIARMFARHGATLNFTCFEMTDEEQKPAHASCSPEGLLRQVARASRRAGVRLAGENALPRLDRHAHDQMVRKSLSQLDDGDGDRDGDGDEHRRDPMSAFTFLRMSESLFYGENWAPFVTFVRHMQEGRIFQPREQQQEHCFEAELCPPFLHEEAFQALTSK